VETDLAIKAGLMMGISLQHRDDVELAGNFCVWACSEAARFLKGRFVHVNWDVNELVAMREDIEDRETLLTLGLDGYPAFKQY